MESVMKKQTLIVSSLAALLALSSFAQAREGYGFRRAEFRHERREVRAYERYERPWAREQRVVDYEGRPTCEAPARVVVEEPVRRVAPISLGLRLPGLRVGLNL
jgi:hypothetical protein